ncbi:UNKNOWN [Stylonychia lemnae]|uniref:Uncharacterized protein n=1 Tax=Stylonychia lemnae TaxID=5949 RepID=A0A078A9A1_STYLE|nr:UNKNOWN [Stylonychia lemnae]|eukprot:CDW78426.1 UNKNOWN [Stylonychia lemnae]
MSFDQKTLQQNQDLDHSKFQQSAQPLQPHKQSTNQMNIQNQMNKHQSELNKLAKQMDKYSLKSGQVKKAKPKSSGVSIDRKQSTNPQFYNPQLSTNRGLNEKEHDQSILSQREKENQAKKMDIIHRLHVQSKPNTVDRFISRALERYASGNKEQNQVKISKLITKNNQIHLDHTMKQETKQKEPTQDKIDLGKVINLSNYQKLTNQTLQPPSEPNKILTNESQNLKKRTLKPKSKSSVSNFSTITINSSNTLIPPKAQNYSQTSTHLVTANLKPKIPTHKIQIKKKINKSVSQNKFINSDLNFSTLQSQKSCIPVFNLAKVESSNIVTYQSQKSIQSQKLPRQYSKSIESYSSKDGYSSKSSIKTVVHHKQSNSILSDQISMSDKFVTQKSNISDNSIIDKSPRYDVQKQKLKQITLKINYYCKEITLSLIKEFIACKMAPSRVAYKAARCLCLILNAFYNFALFRDSQFKNWSEIKSFFIYRSNHIIQDIENLRARCESNNPFYNEKNINIVKTEILANQEENEGGDLMSPKVKNLIYKPIFCYTYFLLAYLNQKQQCAIDLPRKSTYSSSSHHSRISSLDNSRINDQINEEQQHTALNINVQNKVNIADQILSTINRALETREYKTQVNTEKKPLIKKKNIKTLSQSFATKRNSNFSSKSQSIKLSSHKDSNYSSRVNSIQKDTSQSRTIDVSSSDFKLDNFDVLTPPANFQSIDFRSAAQTADKNLDELIYQSISMKKNDSILTEEVPERPIRDFKKQRAYRMDDDSSIEIERERKEETQFINTMDKKLADTLKSNIKGMGRDQTIKIEDLILQVKNQNADDSGTFISSKKRYSLVFQSNKKLYNDSSSRITSNETMIEPYRDSYNTQTTETEKEADRNISLRNELSNQEEMKAIENERDIIIKALKERREASNDRKKGNELEKKTLETINSLIKKTQDLIDESLNFKSSVDRCPSIVSVKDISMPDSENEDRIRTVQERSENQEYTIQSILQQQTKSYQDSETKQIICQVATKQLASKIKHKKSQSAALNEKQRKQDHNRIRLADKLISRFISK